MSASRVHDDASGRRPVGSGLWEKVTPDGVVAVVVVTVAADPSVAVVHDRMPAIMGLEAARAWLAGRNEQAMGVVGPVAGRVEPVH